MVTALALAPFCRCCLLAWRLRPMSRTNRRVSGQSLWRSGPSWRQRLHYFRIVLGSLYGLMPLWLNHQGVSDSGIGFWMAVMVSAGIEGQWPIGRSRRSLRPSAGPARSGVFRVILGCLAMLKAAMAPALSCWGFRLHALSGGYGLGLRKKLSVISWWR